MSFKCHLYVIYMTLMLINFNCVWFVYLPYPSTCDTEEWLCNDLRFEQSTVTRETCLLILAIGWNIMNAS